MGVREASSQAYYNMTITCVSAIVALAIGGIELWDYWLANSI